MGIVPKKYSIVSCVLCTTYYLFFFNKRYLLRERFRNIIFSYFDRSFLRAEIYHADKFAAFRFFSV